MPLPNVEQPQFLPVAPGFRLKKYDGDYLPALKGYQDPVVYQNSEGIFDPAKVPSPEYVKGMFEYLDAHGELYFIEALEETGPRAVGDVTVKDCNPPIAIWKEQYRGRGLGFLVMQTVIARLRELGYTKITGSTVYTWNTASQKLHEKLGFRLVKQEGDDLFYELEL